MLEFIREKASERKLRLFACACCRRIWHEMEDQRSRRAVETAEQFADGHCSREELDLAWRKSWMPENRACRYLTRLAASAASAASTWYDADDIYHYLESGVAIPAEQFAHFTRSAEQKAQRAAAWKAAQTVLKPAAAAAATRTESRSQAALVHEIIGNPFRPVTVDPTWLTATVTSLATAIYADRAFDQLPILADALEDAGCTNADMLNHCRQPGDHVRGCWVVDWVLKKQ